MKDVKCPVCGSHNVEVDDVIDFWSDEDGKGVELLYKDTIGHCEDCGVRLRWKEVFRYLAIEDLEEA
jgi:DNA-directed RNA polymerase subunit RPC12/RpoP